MRRLPALALLLALGCNRAAPPTPTSSAVATSAPAEEPPGHELDVAKHRIPSAPLAGRYAGRGVTPTVALNGPTLIVRVPAEGEGRPATELKFSFAGPAEKLVVRHEQPPGAAVPVLTIESGRSVSEFENGYALTLELGEVAGGARPGRMYLSLPDPETSFLAGEFRAELERDYLTTPPGPLDAPYLAGSVALPAGAVGTLRCGVVGVGGDAATTPVAEELEFKIEAPDAGAVTGFSQNPNPPRAGALSRSAPGRYRYEHTKLPAGRYLVYCRLDGGPCAFAHADLGAGGATLDFALDPAKAGSVRVTVPKALGAAEVQLIPVDPKADPAAPDFAQVLDLALRLSAKADAEGVALVERVPAGAYTVRVPGRQEDVTVVAGQVARVGVK